MTSEWARCAAPIIRLPISILGEDEAVLMEDWHIEWVGPLWEGVTVPAGTTTDGASIPRMLWRVCGHPLEAPRVYAALLHDWLYGGCAGGGGRAGAPCLREPADQGTGRAGAPCLREPAVTRKEADRCYYALLRHFGVAGWRAKIEYWALRLFGGSHWKKGKQG